MCVCFFSYKRNGTEVTAWNIRENIISQRGMSITHRCVSIYAPMCVYNICMCLGGVEETHDGAYMSIIPPLLLIISWSPLAIFQSVENDTIKKENTYTAKNIMKKKNVEKYVWSYKPFFFLQLLSHYLYYLYIWWIESTHVRTYFFIYSLLCWEKDFFFCFSHFLLYFHACLCHRKTNKNTHRR